MAQDIYRPQTCVSVILFIGKGGSLSQGVSLDSDDPLDRHPLNRAPSRQRLPLDRNPQTETPGRRTPWTENPLDKDPPVW